VPFDFPLSRAYQFFKLEAHSSPGAMVDLFSSIWDGFPSFFQCTLMKLGLCIYRDNNNKLSNTEGRFEVSRIIQPKKPSKSPLLCWRICGPPTRLPISTRSKCAYFLVARNLYWHNWKLYTKIQVDRRKFRTCARPLFRMVKMRPKGQLWGAANQQDLNSFLSSLALKLPKGLNFKNSTLAHPQIFLLVN